MHILLEAQVRKVYDLTGALLLNRDWVVVPLVGSERGLERMLPDGKILIRPAAGDRFDGWFAGLQTRLEGLDLSRALRASQLERHYLRTPAEAVPGSGARKYVKGLPAGLARAASPPAPHGPPPSLPSPGP
jgi:hypothetical protein